MFIQTIAHLHTQARKRTLRSSGPADMDTAATDEPEVKKRGVVKNKCKGTAAFHCPTGQYGGPKCNVRSYVLFGNEIINFFFHQ